MDYKARVSSVFQNCDPRTNVAVLHPFPDLWMKHGLQRDPFPVFRLPSYQFQLWEAIHQNGSGCDYVSEKLLAESKAEAGRLEVKGRRYDALIVMEAQTVEPATAKALERYAEAGGKIIFIRHAPSQSPGFQNWQENDGVVRAASERILKAHPDRCAVVPPPGRDLTAWYGQVQKQFGIEPLVRIENPDVNLSQIAFTQGKREVFFFVNSGIEGTIETLVEFPGGGKTPWQWGPESGERFAYPYEGQKNRLRLRIEPCGSLLLVLEPSMPGTPRRPALPSEKNAFALASPWRVRLEHVSGDKNEITLDRLVDFKDDERLRPFAGEAVYRQSFEVNGPARFEFIDLGAVHGISSVTLNGRNLGLKWYGRHIYHVQGALRAGRNEWEVRVTTVLGNYCKSLKDNPVAQRWTERQPWNSVGLVGPVRLLGGEKV